ncbi:MAG: hypothetical protein KatS3mg111_1424 [Pirellulaceae bacterium]|nr:MAG: hypothetical protein KatS3mg111_1424 [Pirellulaceae bacterium]
MAVNGKNRNRTADCARQVRRRWAMRACLLLVVGVAMLPASAAAQDPVVEREAKIKAAYLYQFLNYIQWAPGTFQAEDSPLVIGVVGDDPVNKYLKVIAAHRKANNRRLEYREVQTPDDAAGCHILFFGDQVAADTIRQYIQERTGDPVLLVGENPSFIQIGGIIAFVVADNHVRLQLSMKEASKRGLRVSSQLAKIAHVVD